MAKRIYVFVAFLSSTRAFTVSPKANPVNKVRGSGAARRTMVLSVEEGFSSRIHEVGLGMKSRGLAYRDRMHEARGVLPKLGFAAGALVNFILFTVYRAYRGFFVILPAVFVEVRRKLEREELRSLDVTDDVDPKTGKLKLRSAILMNLGAAVFTAVLLIRTAFQAIATLFTKRPSSDLSTQG
mmetsp:Transcript_16009/g.50192  ORF Transcript_16009/g.50192 Transcript_16009/m.50192 type:complete len:183 (+) Transcript_16009:138-686(+)|eukprot:CAMPEP_0197395060 /NCGR_PEP_ID=MMETSP1165-20131217/6314_1 /TAXON_ID=284809 /ORGANISM="Chrysocystis fragilis, Strain CCMP3189" /LENGTH=182 /DNA_ID=CAMNT_0042920807 /DNA_START=132 /DNA_END=680 /DNA_ORIENTATION=-